MLFICVLVRWGVLLASGFFLGGFNMELAYVCEWEKRPKSTHCPSIPLVCSWSCRNLVAFTTDLKNEDDDKGEHLVTVHPPWAPVGWTLPSAYSRSMHSQWLTREVFALFFVYVCFRCQSHDPHHRHWAPLGCLLHQLWTQWGHFLSGVGSIRCAERCF